MKPKDDQLKVKKAYANDQVPEWWDAAPTHEELLAAEIDSQRHQEHEDNSPWLAEAYKKGPKPF
jgi:hypothetical protein